MRIKLSEYAKQNSVTWKTAYNWFKAGKLDAIQLDTGTILVNVKDEDNVVKNRAFLYSRVSPSENKDNLTNQRKRLEQYAAARGYVIKYNVSEVGGGLNDKRKKLCSVLSKNDWDILIVEHKDRLTRFGFNYIDLLITKGNQVVEVINIAEDDTGDLMQDLVSVITSFCARIYGSRRSKRKTEKIIKELSDNESNE